MGSDLKSFINKIRICCYKDYAFFIAALAPYQPGKLQTIDSGHFTIQKEQIILINGAQQIVKASEGLVAEYL